MDLPQPVTEGVLLRRFQRFLAEVRVSSGAKVLAHVPNSGRLTGVAVPGNRCFLTKAAGKLSFRLEVVEANGVMVGVNTWRAAQLAEEALVSGLLLLPHLRPPFTLRREVKLGEGTRLDLLLEDAQGRFWVEVKNITWAVDGMGLFPDAVTARGAKHLKELARLCGQGLRAAVVYVAQRADVQQVRAAGEVDPTYAQKAQEAASLGVRFVALRCHVSPQAITPQAQVPVVFPP
jgi:sugar fermentation stimulation protein A